TFGAVQGIADAGESGDGHVGYAINLRSDVEPGNPELGDFSLADLFRLIDGVLTVVANADVEKRLRSENICAAEDDILHGHEVERAKTGNRAGRKTVNVRIRVAREDFPVVREGVVAAGRVLVVIDGIGSSVDVVGGSQARVRGRIETDELFRDL